MYMHMNMNGLIYFHDMNTPVKQAPRSRNRTTPMPHQSPLFLFLVTSHPHNHHVTSGISDSLGLFQTSHKWNYILWARGVWLPLLSIM